MTISATSTTSAKPTVCALLGKLGSMLCQLGRTPAMRLGIFPLVVNIPFGYACIALSVCMGASSGGAIWKWIGMGGYGLSWLMLAAGTWLAGSQAKRQLSSRVRCLFKGWRRLRRARGNTGT